MGRKLGRPAGAVPDRNGLTGPAPSVVEHALASRNCNEAAPPTGRCYAWARMPKRSSKAARAFRPGAW